MPSQVALAASLWNACRSNLLSSYLRCVWDSSDTGSERSEGAWWVPRFGTQILLLAGTSEPNLRAGLLGGEPQWCPFWKPEFAMAEDTWEASTENRKGAVFCPGRCWTAIGIFLSVFSLPLPPSALKQVWDFRKGIMMNESSQLHGSFAILPPHLLQEK